MTLPAYDVLAQTIITEHFCLYWCHFVSLIMLYWVLESWQEQSYDVGQKSSMEHPVLKTSGAQSWEIIIS